MQHKVPIKSSATVIYIYIYKKGGKQLSTALPVLSPTCIRKAVWWVSCTCLASAACQAVWGQLGSGRFYPNSTWSHCDFLQKPISSLTNDHHQTQQWIWTLEINQTKKLKCITVSWLGVDLWFRVILVLTVNQCRQSTKACTPTPVVPAHIWDIFQDSSIYL